MTRILLAMLVAGLVSCAPSSVDDSGAPSRWEYQTMAGSPDPVALEKHLNAAGSEGWELVATSAGQPPFEKVFILKRPLKEAQAQGPSTR